jgi:hypothetical protein
VEMALRCSNNVLVLHLRYFSMVIIRRGPFL